MKNTKFLFALATIFLSALAIYATVTFNAATGTGFVGKGDVQLVYNWNNADLQKNADAVSFYAESLSSVSYGCEWWTGPERNRSYHTVTHTKTSQINSTVQRELRKNKVGDVTGFILTGYGLTVESGDAIPQVGDPCPGNAGTGAVVYEVGSVESTGSGLFVSYAGMNYQLAY